MPWRNAQQKQAIPALQLDKMTSKALPAILFNDYWMFVHANRNHVFLESTLFRKESDWFLLSRNGWEINRSMGRDNCHTGQPKFEIHMTYGLISRQYYKNQAV